MDQGRQLFSVGAKLGAKHCDCSGYLMQKGCCLKGSECSCWAWMPSGSAKCASFLRQFLVGCVSVVVCGSPDEDKAHNEEELCALAEVKRPGGEVKNGAQQAGKHHPNGLLYWDIARCWSTKVEGEDEGAADGSSDAGGENINASLALDCGHPASGLRAIQPRWHIYNLYIKEQATGRLP